MSARTVRPDDPKWLKNAFGDLGLKELPGARHSARVLEMFRQSGHSEVKDDETAWCAAAVGAWLHEAGLPGSGSLMARSYAKYGTRLDASKRLPRGAILVWPRGAPPSGHVNVLLEDDGNTLTCIGGNQSNAVTVVRSAKADLLAAVWPLEAPRKPVEPPKPGPIPTPPPSPKTKPEPLPESPPESPLPPTRQPDDPGVPESPEVPKASWLLRVGRWVAGALFGGGAVYAYGDWQVIVALILTGLFAVTVLAGISLGAALWLFGKERVRAWLSNLLTR